MVVTNNNSKITYDYERLLFSELTDEKLMQWLGVHKAPTISKASGQSTFARWIKTFKQGNGKGTKGYYYICCGFDIETTLDVQTESSYMYIWQMSINNNVVLGRTWQEFIALLDWIKNIIRPTQNQRIILWVCNLSYEFQFMRQWLTINSSDENFLKEQRQPLKITHDSFIEFRDTVCLTNMKLSKLAETYTNTQKCVNDLDYSVQRNSLTPLSELEYGYCCNDVLILSEFADYIFNEYMAKGIKCPMTQTGGLTDECKKCLSNLLDNDQKSIDNWHYINSLKFPDTQAEYNEIMSYLYRGGFTHSDVLYVDEDLQEDECKSILGVDITSSYPYSMINPIFPIWFKECQPEHALSYINDGKCVCMLVTFTNIHSTDLHSIESESKCIECDNPTLDNGRVYKADKITVWLTEYDYFSYTRFYTWDEMTVIKAMCSDKGYMPSHIVKPMLMYGIKKQELKRDGLNYTLEKIRFNTFYGMNAKKLNEGMTKYDNTNLWWDDVGQEYSDQTYKAIVNPYLGIYISAFSRYRLLTLAYLSYKNFGVRSIYCDTDSHKFIGTTPEFEKWLNEYNNQIIEENKVNISHFTEYNDLLSDLGTWDVEYKRGTIKRFKTLGAKRYLIWYDKEGEMHLNQTIAGLPKGTLEKMYTTVNEIFENFTDDMICKDVKLLPKYNDEPMSATITDVYGNTEIMYEKSNVALIPKAFSMSINDIWSQMLIDYQMENEALKVEKRIW